MGFMATNIPTYAVLLFYSVKNRGHYKTKKRERGDSRI